MSSGVKNPATQILSSAASILVLKIGGSHSQPVDISTSLSATLSGRVFANTQDASMYKEFMNTDKEM